MSRMPTLFAEFIFNGVFERFPGLTIVGGEVGAGWVPFLKQELDDRYRRNRYWCEVNLEHAAERVLRRNCKVGFVSDHFGVQNCDAVGVENMMWCSDFPHHITDWPHSQYLINSMAQGIDPARSARSSARTPASSTASSSSLTRNRSGLPAPHGRRHDLGSGHGRVAIEGARGEGERRR